MKMKNREFKFRMWGGDDSNKMFYKSDNVINCLKQQIDFNEGLKFGYDHIGLHGSVFMQWTGLKDRNGQEIYEGDLVKSWNLVDNPRNANDKIPSVCEVVWEKNFYGIKRVKGNGFTGLYISDGQFGVEVIGNIFEHPHLVEKAKTDLV